MGPKYLGRYLILLGNGANFLDCEYYTSFLLSALFPVWTYELKKFSFSFLVCEETLIFFCSYMLGTSMEGPIPSNISLLTNLTEL